MFEIVPDARLRMLRVTLRGFWGSEVMGSYMRAVRRAMGDLKRTGGCRYVLINMIDFPIQSKDVADGHAANLQAVREAGRIRVALVMQSGLSKLQAVRVATDTGHRTFYSEEAALDWLLAGHAHGHIESAERAA